MLFFIIKNNTFFQHNCSGYLTIVIKNLLYFEIDKYNINKLLKKLCCKPI